MGVASAVLATAESCTLVESPIDEDLFRTIMAIDGGFECAVFGGITAGVIQSLREHKYQIITIHENRGDNDAAE